MAAYERQTYSSTNQVGYIMHLSMLAPTPLPGEVRQSRGFDLIRIQLPHPPGNIQIQIPPSYTGIHGVTGNLTRHVYEWHEPVLLHRYKRERNPAQSAGQASWMPATIRLLSQKVTKNVLLHTYFKIATSRGPTQKRGTRVSTVKQSTRVQTQRDAR